MMKAEDRIAVEAIIAQAPFNINGIADYQIVEFTPTMFCDNALKDIFGLFIAYCYLKWRDTNVWVKP